MALYYFINTGRGNQVFNNAAKLSGKEREDFYVSLSRGFKPASDFLSRFRLKPCAALLSFIHYRLMRFDYKEFDENMRKYFVRLRRLTGNSLQLMPLPKLVYLSQVTKLNSEVSGKILEMLQV